VGYGYMGQLLWIDLSSGTVEKEELKETLTDKFLGGKGLGAKLLWDQVPPGTDPYDENNLLMFLSGPLTGTLAPSMRGCVVTKSPLTGIFADSYFGGSLAPEIKYAGYDGIVIKGKAPEPVYLLVEGERVEIRPAKHLWGLDTFKTSWTLKQEIGEGKDPKIACIGPAGENLVRFALISCEYNRHAGRCGCGAVMGSKNLKAIAVIGERGVQVKDKAAFIEAVNRARHELRESPYIEAFRIDGTPGSIPFADAEGLLPVFNYRQGTFHGSRKIDNEAQRERLWLKDTACFSCPVACSKVGVIRRGKHRGTIVDVVEYESAALMGANLGLDNLEEVAYLVYLCDALGLDSMSTGGVLGYFLETVERGLIPASSSQWGFGKPEGIEELIKQIAYRSSEIGNILAEGVKRAAGAIGQGSEKWAVHVKGLETPAWGPRGAPGMGLAYMTGDRGGCHQRAFPILYEVGGERWRGRKFSRLEIEGKAELVVYLQNYLAGLDTLVKCDFAAYGITADTYASLVRAATGKDITAADLELIGERIWNLTRLFNCREGIERDQDSLPARFQEEPLPDGPAAGHFISPSDCDKMLDEYYQLRGWDARGRPFASTLERLGLS